MKSLQKKFVIVVLFHILTCSVFFSQQDNNLPKLIYPNKVSNKNKSKNNNKTPSKPLPHQLPDFFDDCTRYYYWYYVNYLDTISHPVYLEFMKNDGQLNSYSCFLEPFRKWESVNRKKLYCYALVDDYLRILAGLPLLNTKNSQYSGHLTDNYTIYLDFTYFDSCGYTISPELIREGNVISYNRYYLFYKVKNNQFRTFYNNINPLVRILYTQCGHTAIIADILRHDKENQIFLLILLNKPYDFYSLLLYDYKNQIIIDDVSFVKKYQPYLHIMNRKFNFEFYDKHYLLDGGWEWMSDPAPFIDVYFNQVNIIETMNIYKLFEWYNNNKIPSNYINSINKNKK